MRLIDTPAMTHRQADALTEPDLFGAWMASQLPPTWPTARRLETLRAEVYRDTQDLTEQGLRAEAWERWREEVRGG